jgi:hypothetical protein
VVKTSAAFAMQQCSLLVACEESAAHFFVPFCAFSWQFSFGYGSTAL